MVLYFLLLYIFTSQILFDHRICAYADKIKRYYPTLYHYIGIGIAVDIHLFLLIHGIRSAFFRCNTWIPQQIGYILFFSGRVDDASWNGQKCGGRRAAHLQLEMPII